MNCYRCNTDNEAGAHFCKQCGADLWNASPAAADDGARKSMIYVLVLLGWEYFTYLVWFVLQRTLMRSTALYRSHFLSTVTIYKIISWTFGGIELILLAVFAALSKNMTARICLIAFMAIRILLILLYTFS